MPIRPIAYATGPVSEVAIAVIGRSHGKVPAAAAFARAGTLGLPLMVAIIGGQTHRFRPLVDLYRESGRRAGHAPETLKVGLHALGYVADTTGQAIDDFFPGYARAFTKAGAERGWPPVTRAGFDALRKSRRRYCATARRSAASRASTCR